MILKKLTKLCETFISKYHCNDEEIMKKVQVLLSTYNGGKYLEEQLESILKQDYPDISVLIRDDGSSDHTLNIIKKYVEYDSRISYYSGVNIGVINSFFDLMKNADITADYFAFSDQDDVWKPNKISKAIVKLEGNHQDPILYCSDTELVNEELDPIKSHIKKARITPGFGNALVENVCVGCTCVFNLKLLELVKNHIPDYTIMHDWWLYLSASAFGKVVYDENAYILYRQHSGNVMGMRLNYIEEFKSRVKNFKKIYINIRSQALDFKTKYNIDKDKLTIINYVINAKKNILLRFHIAFSKKIYRQRKLDSFIVKILFICGFI